MKVWQIEDLKRNAAKIPSKIHAVPVNISATDLSAALSCPIIEQVYDLCSDWTMRCLDSRLYSHGPLSNLSGCTLSARKEVSRWFVHSISRQNESQHTHTLIASL